jgi:hypothetical protein
MWRTGWVIGVAALAAIALHLVAGYLPEEAAWSVWPYTSLPAALGWLGALLVASLALPPVNDTVGRWAHRLWEALPAKAERLRWFAIVALASGGLFWLFRIRHLRWGDARFLVRALSYTGPDRPIWTIYNWQSPLTLFTHAQLWLLLNPSPGVSVDTLYAISSILSGIGFVFVLFLLADLLGRDRLEKATIFGLVVTAGAMQLFFGYVENYTIMSLGLIVTLYLGVRCLRGEIGLIWPSLALAITNAFHPSTVVLWPPMGYVAWKVTTRPATGNGSPREGAWRVREWTKFALPPILVFIMLAAFMTAAGHGPAAMLVSDRPGGADAIPFVPLFQTTTRYQHYTMFSLEHLVDWANEHFLISPFGLLLLLLALVTAAGGRLTRRPKGDGGSAHGLPQMNGYREITAFLTIASVVYLLLTFVWNPDYGGRRDWDLFAPSAFVYTSLAAYLLVRQAGDRRQLARAVRLLIGASALHTAAWIYSNSIL